MSLCMRGETEIIALERVIELPVQAVDWTQAPVSVFSFSRPSPQHLPVTASRAGPTLFAILRIPLIHSYHRLSIFEFQQISSLLQPLPCLDM